MTPPEKPIDGCVPRSNRSKATSTAVASHAAFDSTIRRATPSAVAARTTGANPATVARADRFSANQRPRHGSVIPKCSDARSDRIVAGPVPSMALAAARRAARPRLYALPSSDTMCSWPPILASRPELSRPRTQLPVPLLTTIPTADIGGAYSSGTMSLTNRTAPAGACDSITFVKTSGYGDSPATGADEHPMHPNANWPATNSDRIDSKTVVRPAVAAAVPAVPIETDP